MDDAAGRKPVQATTPSSAAIPPELARLVVKAMTPESRGSLWGRVYEAIANGDEDEVAAIRAEFGSPEALHAALMKDAP